jgi:gliding motility-associated-like protein
VPATITLVSNAVGGSIAWSNDPTFSDTLNASPSDEDILVNITSDSTFYISVYNGFCNEVDTVNIFYASLSPVITGLNTICIGDTAVLTATNSVPGSTYTIDWSPNTGIVSGDGTSTIVVAPGDSTTYTVVFSTPSGCSDTASYLVNVVDPTGSGFVAWPDDYVIFSGDSTIIHAAPSTGITYTWVPSTSLSHPDSANSYAFPTVTTIYAVTGDFGTCTATDTLIIRVMDFICDDKYVYLPNAFTPNGDGVNDVLLVRTSDKVEIYLAVFERWGEKVFETSDKNFGWDGKVNGKDADPAVFDYYLKAVCPGGQELFKKGNITLIR